MFIQGKHAEVRLHEEQIRVFKTYKDPLYVENEFFALDFLARQAIMNLNPKKESNLTVSMDWIKKAKSPKMKSFEERKDLIVKLVAYLKNLHESSYKFYGSYITHEDLFLDNLLICENFGTLYFIDWGLSQKRSTVYPDIASAALGAFNEYPDCYKIFLEEYFEDISVVNMELISLYVHQLYEKYKQIRQGNNIETDSLESRLNKAQEIIKILSI